MTAPSDAPTTAPIGPAAAPPMMAPLVKAAPPRFEPSSGFLANAVFAAMLMASRPAISAGLRNLVVQVPMIPRKCERAFCSRGSLGARIGNAVGQHAGEPPTDSGEKRRSATRSLREAARETSALPARPHPPT